MMIQTLKNIFRINASTNTNWFIYCFKRIPLIGKALSENIYRDTALKNTVAVIVFILNILGKLLGKVLNVILLIIVPVLLIIKEPSLRNAYFLHIYILLNLFGSFINSDIFENKRIKFICIRLMRMDAGNFIIVTMLYNSLIDFLSLLLTLIISSVLMGGTVIQGILLSIMSICFTFLGEAFHLFVFSKTGNILSKKALYFVVIAMVCIAAAYLPAILHMPIAFDKPFLLWLCFFIILSLGVSSLYTILQYKRYPEIATATLKASLFMLDTKKAMAEARFANVVMREKEFDKTDLTTDKYHNRKGYAYLNAIFFDRHKRLLIKPVFVRICFIALVFLAGVIASILNLNITKSNLNAGQILPVFVFIMYFVSIGEQVCKAMFYNCDNSLLRYSFYRDKNAILSNFRIRLLHLAGMNLIIAAAISAAVVGLVAIMNLQWSLPSIAFFIFSILLLSLFFSVHYLFLYYVFQPYTSELGMKNPFFKIINSAVYLVCFICLQIKSAPTYFTLIVLISTLSYIIIALIMVYKFAPKNFRVK